MRNGFTDVNSSFKPDKVVVAVNAPFGDGAKAAKILDSYATVATTDEESADAGAKAPALTSARKPFDLETALGSATPLSDFFGWSVLKDYRSPFWPKALVDDPTPLSNKFGWSVLYGAFSGARRRREGVASPEKAFPAPAATDVPKADAEQVSNAGAAGPDEVRADSSRGTN